MTDDLAALKAEIDLALDAHLPKTSEIAQPVVEAMRHSVLGGGKRLRPMLVSATCAALGAPTSRAMPAACAIEFIHAYSLIHDDLPAMDDDEIRHGLPSAHIAFGEANAILAGDSLHSLAFQTIAESNQHAPPEKLEMIQLLASAAGWSGMAGGQCLDIAAEGKDLSLEELKTLHAAKTGALIRVAVQIGAVSAAPHKASAEQFVLLSKFGDLMGLAFQVMDDVLDVTQSTEVLGKPAGSDEALQKNTFPKLMGIDNARALAEELIGNATHLLDELGLSAPGLYHLSQLVVNRQH